MLYFSSEVVEAVSTKLEPDDARSSASTSGDPTLVEGSRQKRKHWTITAAEERKAQRDTVIFSALKHTFCSLGV